MPKALIVLLLCLSAAAQISPPRDKPADYPVHVSVPGMDLAAEYLVHNLPGPQGVIFIRDYLVVEVAAYPKTLDASWKTSQFTLRINRKGTPLLSQSAGVVAGSIKYQDLEQRPITTAEAGIGDRGVIFGRPAQVPRFPGDPSASPVPLPRPPEPENPAGENKEPELSVDEICRHQALSDGPIRKTANGFLYFPFSGKLKSIRSLELLYEAPDGTKTTLTLL